jgi:uncharacterized protein (TIGR00369 family)
MQPRMSIAEIEALIDQYFPDGWMWSRIVSLADRALVLRMPFRKELVRAGGTISGPAMMALADTAAYYLLLGYAGPIPEAATANLDIHFLSRPQPVDMLATAHLLRLGRRLAVSTVDIRSEGSDEVVAHATVTYARPPRAT